jgi:hypothetical protein
MQYSPPFKGAGLLQSLLFVWIPEPQVREQDVIEDQTPQIPFTKINIFLLYMDSLLVGFYDLRNTNLGH